jgi:hypothetical protein
MWIICAIIGIWYVGQRVRNCPLEVTGRGVLDVTLWRQQKSLAAHLVNLTNPMLMKGPVRELMPVGEQSVRIRYLRALNQSVCDCWQRLHSEIPASRADADGAGSLGRTS